MEMAMFMFSFCFGIACSAIMFAMANDTTIGRRHGAVLSLSIFDVYGVWQYRLFWPNTSTLKGKKCTFCVKDFSKFDVHSSFHFCSRTIKEKSSLTTNTNIVHSVK